MPIGSWKDTPNKMEESSNVFKVTHLLCCYDVYLPCADRVLTVPFDVFFGVLFGVCFCKH